MQPEKLYITAKEASKLCGYSVAWFSKMRLEKKGPPYIKPNGGRALYSVKELIDWFNIRGK
ncbi:helix-turn-helix domain-containing protein [bacterium]|nr:helix-turn-helix domain-containing protein [bacterium]